MYKQVLDPVGNSLFVSSLFALIPLATLFILLGGLKMKAHIAALSKASIQICARSKVWIPRLPSSCHTGIRLNRFSHAPARATAAMRRHCVR